MDRGNIAEGAEKPFKRGDKLPNRRGGKPIDYFWKYPNPSGSWIESEE